MATARKSYCKKHTIFSGERPVGVRFDYSDGVSRTHNLADLESNIVARLACHGLEQKGGDTSSDPTVTNAAQMRAVVDEIWERLQVGEWNREREGGQGGPAREDIETAIRARANYAEGDVAKFFALGDSERKAWLAKPAVRAAIAQAKADRLATSVGDEETPDF